MHTTAIIPAFEEAATIGAVVDVARASPLVDEVLVVDGDSGDDTVERASEHGAKVLVEPRPGKGEAMLTGVKATDAEVIVFLDADLTGLRPAHVDRLVRTVTAGGALMSCGLFDRGPMANLVWLHFLPILTGERAMRRELFESLDADDITGYRVEAALNARAAELGGPVGAFICAGMFHRTKEDKFDDPLRGFLAKVQMILTALGSYVRYWTHRRIRGLRRTTTADG